MSIEFESTGGPYGDAMSTYDVTSEARTIRDFVLEVLTNRKNEWGCFCIDRMYEYRYGNLLNNIPDIVLNQEIDYPIKANGGWTSMDYRISTK